MNKITLWSSLMSRSSVMVCVCVFCYYKGWLFFLAWWSPWTASADFMEAMFLSYYSMRKLESSGKSEDKRKKRAPPYTLKPKHANL